MDDIQWKFSDKFRSHWIKVKFYKEKPNLKEAKKLKNVKFCEATNETMMNPILLDKESISCAGAQHAFGWRSNSKSEFLENCYDKRQTQKNILKSIISQTPCFKKPFEYIGLNTDGTPDLVMSYMPPGEVMDLIKIYQNYQGGNLNVSLCTMMSICLGIAVKTFLEDTVSFSFGCDDSRKYADMRRANLAVGIPKSLFNMFVD